MNDLLEKLKSIGSAKIPRSQLPDVHAAGISNQDLADNQIEVVDDEVFAEDDELIVICVSAHRFMFADNVFTVCVGCGGAIQHRPNVPAKARTMCLTCAEEHVDKTIKEQSNAKQ
jgi:hypothetical protein